MTDWRLQTRLQTNYWQFMVLWQCFHEDSKENEKRWATKYLRLLYVTISMLKRLILHHFVWAQEGVFILKPSCGCTQWVNVLGWWAESAYDVNIQAFGGEGQKVLKESIDGMVHKTAMDHSIEFRNEAKRDKVIANVKVQNLSLTMGSKPNLGLNFESCNVYLVSIRFATYENGGLVSGKIGNDMIDASSESVRSLFQNVLWSFSVRGWSDMAPEISWYLWAVDAY